MCVRMRKGKIELVAICEWQRRALTAVGCVCVCTNVVRQNCCRWYIFQQGNRSSLTVDFGKGVALEGDIELRGHDPRGHTLRK